MEKYSVDHLFPGFSFYKNINCTEEMFWHLKSNWCFALIWVTNSLNAFFISMGFILNPLSFYLISKDKSDTVLFFILRYLAIFDIIVLLICAGDTICHTSETIPHLSRRYRFFFMYTHNHLWMFQASVVAIRNYSVTYLATCRCFSIMYPMRAKQIFTQRISLVVLLSLPVIIIPVNFLKLVEYKTEIAQCKDGVYSAMRGSKYFHDTYTWLSTILLSSALPTTICIATNVMLLVTLRQSNDRFTTMDTSRRTGGSSVQKQVTRMVLMLSTMFIIGQLGLFLYAVPVMYISSVWIFTYFNLLGTLINDIDSSCNFFVYVYANPRFSKELIKLLPCLKGWVLRIRRPETPAVTNASFSGKASVAVGMASARLVNGQTSLPTTDSLGDR